MQRPLVSVIVPAYNAAAFLGETLTSVSAQTYKDLEIIVVDDGSTDITCEIVAEHVQRDPRIRLIRQINAGVGAARNAGIAAAIGRYVAPIDADDTWHPDKILLQVEEMERRGERTGFVYCWARLTDEAGQVTGDQPPCAAQGRVFNALLFRNFLHSASIPLFRMAALHQVGGYATRDDQGGAQGCEDWELCLRVAEHYEVGVVPRFLVGYRVVGTGMSFNVEGMERSFRYMVGQTRRRVPSVPPKLVAWSTSHFYLYLALKAKRSGQFDAAQRCLKAAARADLSALLAPRFYQILGASLRRRPQSAATLFTATPFAPPAPSTPPAPRRWTLRRLVQGRVFWVLYLRIERRRFAHLLGSPAQ